MTGRSLARGELTREEVVEYATWLWKRAGILRPPVCPYAIAANMGYTVHEVAPSGGHVARARNVAPPGLPEEWIIEVDPNAYYPRRNFQLAHELIEIGFSDRVGETRKAESLFDTGASELLMPSEMFRDAIRDVGIDLDALRSLFSTASAEAVALRLLAEVTAVITIVDNGVLRRRVGSVRHPKAPLPFEMSAIRTALESWNVAHAREANAQVAAYPVNPVRNGYRRVIAVTVVDDWD